MAFPDSFLDELVSRNEIEDVVSGYVQLTKRSGSNLFGLCPFHSEKTPSFSVSPDKQIYHCFGCGKGGGVINFIMEIENLSFPDAVAFLAKRAGMEMPEDDTPKDVRNKRARLLELNRDAARFFYDTLSTPAGADASAYIKRRGISRQMAVRFGLGAAPDSWSALLDSMSAKGYSHQEMYEAGLIRKSRNGSGFYDYFRNRLMFPVIDVRGSVIGFSGRALGDNEPKYLNSPDTPVFNKSRCLFALNLAKKTKQGMLILSEGNIDVVSLHQAGFDCAVASLGTSLTSDQARLMTRYTEQVVIAYDADSAGVKASQRAIPILEKAGLNVKVLTIPGAKDPDEFIKANGADAFKKLLESSEDRVDYQLMLIKAKYKLDTDEGRLGYLSEASMFLSGLPNAIEREIYGTRIAETAGVSSEAVITEIKNAYRRRNAAEKKRRETEISRPLQKAQPADRSIRYENVVSAIAEEGVIRLLLLEPDIIDDCALESDDFTSPFLSKVYGLIKQRSSEGRDITPALLLSDLPQAEASRLTVIMQKPEKLSDARVSLKAYIDRIQTEKLKANAQSDLTAITQRYKEKKGYGG